MALASMRGLQMFITDIRNCQTAEQERSRIEKELIKIRTRFSHEKSLSSYDKKKYVCKLLYIHLLGYQLDFGYQEVLSLIGGVKYAEKQVGYLVASCLLHENHDYLNYVIKVVRLDIVGRSEAFQCMALTLAANIGGREYAEALYEDVQRIAVTSSFRPLVRKKAVLCLLHFYHNHPSSLRSNAWPDHIASLLDEKDFGLLLVAMNLLAACVRIDAERYLHCMPKCVRILERLLRGQNIPQDYTFYGIPSPWLQVRTMQVLQQLPVSEDPVIVRMLLQRLEPVVIGTNMVQSINRMNVMHAIMFEAMLLVAQLDAEKTLLLRCVGSSVGLLSVADSNLRYLGMDTMARMLQFADFRESMKPYEPDIVLSLRDPDRCVQRAALDLLYEMSYALSVKHIVQELLEYFPSADFEFQEDIAVKMGLLAEKFAADRSWYVDTILQLVEKGGGVVPDGIWRSLVDFTSKNQDIQAYAATKSREYISKPSVHETMLKVAGPILGETSHLLAQSPEFSPKEVFRVMHDKFLNVSTPTKVVLLEAYIKLLTKAQHPEEDLLKEVISIFEKYGSHLEAEALQRAVTFFSLSQRKPNLQSKSVEHQESAGPSSEPASTGGSPQVDLLGDLLAPLAASQSASVLPDPFQDPLLALDSSALAFSAPNPFLATQPSIQPVGNVADWFTALSKKDSGILYEDPYIQIGVKSQWQGAQGQMSLFLGNKQSAPLTSIQAKISPESHLKLELTGVLDIIQPAAQIQATLKVSCLYMSKAVPVLDFSYTVSGITVALKLGLPIVKPKFLQATDFLPNEFFVKWRALATPQNKLQEVVHDVKLTATAGVADMLNSYHISVGAGLDPNPNNIVAATTAFSETLGAVLCMVRIETDPADRTQLRLTVASAEPRVALELKDFIKEALQGTKPPPPLVVQKSATVVDTKPVSTVPEANNPFAGPSSFWFPPNPGGPTLPVAEQQQQPTISHQSPEPQHGLRSLDPSLDAAAEQLASLMRPVNAHATAGMSNLSAPRSTNNMPVRSTTTDSGNLLAAPLRSLTANAAGGTSLRNLAFGNEAAFVANPVAVTDPFAFLNAPLAASGAAAARIGTVLGTVPPSGPPTDQPNLDLL